MSQNFHILVFEAAGRRYALDIAAVERIVQAVEVTPVTDASRILLGIINVHGTVLPVISLRRRLELPEKAVETTDHFIIGYARKRRLAMVVDRVVAMVEPGKDEGVEVIPGDQEREAAVFHQGRLIPILSLPQLFVAEEEEHFHRLMQTRGAP